MVTPGWESKNAKRNAKRSSARKKAKATLREASGIEAGSSASGVFEQSMDGVDTGASTQSSTNAYS